MSITTADAALFKTNFIILPSFLYVTQKRRL